MSKMTVLAKIPANLTLALVIALFSCVFIAPAGAQVPPSTDEISRYSGLHGVAATGAVSAITEMIANGLDPDARDANGRTPFQEIGRAHV